VCDTRGMVVICAGTSGYTAVADLRYLWMRQKRFQGSHFANDEQAKALTNPVTAGKVDPCLSETFTFEQIPHVHQLMYENRQPPGNMACRVHAPRPEVRELPRCARLEPGALRPVECVGCRPSPTRAAS